jgi:hypothetical protein
MTPDTRKAACACGALAIDLAGDPYFVAACNCTQCQRRTGSIFGVSAYFRGSQLAALRGEAQRFTRRSDAGRPVEFHFCPRCGSTVYWTAPREPPSQGLGVAVGCFADPGFPRPMLIAWCVTKHGWAVFPPDVPTDLTQPEAAEIFG